MDFAAQLASWEDQPLKNKVQTIDETPSEKDHSQKMSSDDFNEQIEKLCAKAQVSFKQSFQDDILALESACKADPSLSVAMELYKAGDKSELNLPAISSLLAVLVTFESEQSLWNTLISLGMACLECETECQQTRFFEAALKGAVIAFPSGVVSKISDQRDNMPEILMVERLLASIRETRPEIEFRSENFKSLEKRLNQALGKKCSSMSDKEGSSQSQKQRKDPYRLGPIKMTAEQASFNQQIEDLFKLNQHEKAWQVFAEMGKSESKPNVATYQLLFKNVRKNYANNRTGDSAQLNTYL